MCDGNFDYNFVPFEAVIMTAVVVTSVLFSTIISKNITNCDYHYKFKTFGRIIAMLLKSHLKGLAKVKSPNQLSMHVKFPQLGGLKYERGINYVQ